MKTKISAGRDLWTESSRAIGLSDIRSMSRRDIAETAKDIFFPAVCPVCGDAIPIERRMAVRRLKRRISQGAGITGTAVPEKMLRAMYPAYVCRECLGELEYIEAPYCKKCGKQLYEDSVTEQGKGDCPAEEALVDKQGRSIRLMDGKLCGDCSKKERSFVQTRCVITYNEAAQEIMAGLKYKSKREYASLLSLLAADRLLNWIKDISPDIAVPVPIHKERLLTRGYNQAELIARGISELTGIPLNTEILYRTKNTKAQKTLTADERLYNLLGAFEARDSFHNKKSSEAYALSRGMSRPAEAGKNNTCSPRVLLIDDIYTTGATMEACTAALTAAGVKTVYGLCICAGRDAPRVQIIRA